MVSTIASIVTLVLFILYLAGRIITIVAVRRIWTDKVIFGKEFDDSYDIVDDVPEVPGYACRGLLTTNEGLRNVHIYEVKYDEYGLPIGKGAQIYERPFLNVNQSLQINVIPGDLYPSLIIEYQTIDYMKVRLEWRDNLKNGVYSELVTPRHTCKSFLYYLCK